MRSSHITALGLLFAFAAVPVAMAQTATVITPPVVEMDNAFAGINGKIFVGRPGPDRFAGSARSDLALGQGGSDYLRGHAGVDFLAGGRGNDRLIGDLGNDRIDTGPGTDIVSAGAGNDRIYSFELDGKKDLLRCGTGVDHVWARWSDAVAADCEIVVRVR
jgi:hypothetical protein